MLTPTIYFVNGIRVLPRDHAITACYLSLLIERPVVGIYNATAGLVKGLVVDLVQSLLDYSQNAAARLSSKNNLNKAPQVPDDKIPDFLKSLGTFKQSDISIDRVAKARKAALQMINEVDYNS